MKLTLNLDYPLEAIEFKTHEDWLEFKKSWTPITDGGTWKHGTYVPEPLRRPYSFPCLMLYDDSNIISNPNGRDWYLSIIIDEGQYTLTED